MVKREVLLLAFIVPRGLLFYWLGLACIKEGPNVIAGPTWNVIGPPNNGLLAAGPVRKQRGEHWNMNMQSGEGSRAEHGWAEQKLSAYLKLCMSVFLIFFKP